MSDLSQPQRLHPMTLLQRFVISLPGLIILMLPLITSPDRSALFSIGTAVLFGLFTIPVIVLQYMRFRFWITESELVIHSGVLTRQKRSIPIDKIQNIAIERQLLPRLFGTAKVKVETAGSTSTEGVIEYVSMETAQQIREAVRLRQRRGVPVAEVGSADGDEEAPAREALLHMPLPRVLLSGSFRFSLLFIAAIFSIFQYVNVEPEEIVDYFTRGRLEWLVDAAAASPYLAAGLSLLVAALLSWLTGIVLNLNRFYGFRLEREEDKLHKRHGLLTVTERTIPLRRVQALILRTNPLMRAFGWYRLELQMMGYDVQEEGHQVVVPFARLHEIQALAPRIVPFSVPQQFARVSRLHIRRTSIRYMAAWSAVVGVGAYFWGPALWGLVALPLLVGYAVVQYRRHGYAFEGDRLFIRRGVFREYTWMLPTEKMQVFYRGASFFQRRLGLASLQIDTAGASPMSYPEIVDLPNDEAARLTDRLYTHFQRSFPLQEGRPQTPHAPSFDEPATRTHEHDVLPRADDDQG